MYITGFWTHYLLSNASVMGKTLLTNITRELAPEIEELPSHDEHFFFFLDANVRTYVVFFFLL